MKSYTAEYRDLNKEDFATRTVLKRGEPKDKYVKSPVDLYHLSGGYCLAGSCARYQNKEVWGVSYTFNDATHGRRYLTRQEAEEHFTRLVFLR